MERETSPRTPEALAEKLAPIERRLRLLAAREADPSSPIHDVPLPPLRTDDEGIDRVILVVGAALSLMPRRWEDLLSSISRYGFTPDAIAHLYEADLALRLKIFARLDAQAPLVRDGLVRIEGWGAVDEIRGAFSSAEIRLTHKGLGAVLDQKYIPKLVEPGDDR